MKNTLEFYYNLVPKDVIKNDDFFYFYIGDELYHFKTCGRKENEIEAIYNINKNIISHSPLAFEIIKNKNKNIITIISGIPYILYKLSFTSNIKLQLSDINHISKISTIQYPEISRANWLVLWSSKIDYLEYQISQFGKKYPLIVDSFSYFIGLAENAISYISGIPKNNNEKLVISHKRISYGTLYELYTPQNIILDHKSRDIAEYIKLSFYNKNKDVFNELKEYFKHNYYSIEEIKLLYGRVLYPSIYFDLYDDIIEGKKDEKEIIKIISSINNYEKYLKDIYNFLRIFYNIPPINWLIKKEVNQY